MWICSVALPGFALCYLLKGDLIILPPLVFWMTHPPTTRCLNESSSHHSFSECCQPVLNLSFLLNSRLPHPWVLRSFYHFSGSKCVFHHSAQLLFFVWVGCLWLPSKDILPKEAGFQTAASGFAGINILLLIFCDSPFPIPGTVSIYGWGEGKSQCTVVRMENILSKTK